MKQLLFAVAVLLLYSGHANSATFNTGDYAVITFSELTYQGTSEIESADFSTVYFPYGEFFVDPDGKLYPVPFLDDGETVLIEVYEEINDTAFKYSNIISTGCSTFSWVKDPIVNWDSETNSFNIIQGDLLWADLEGKLVLTMISGSMELNSIDVSVQINNEIWRSTFEITSVVPIPGSALLLFTGLASLAFNGRKCS